MGQVVLRGVRTRLHSRLHHIQRGVAENAGRSGRRAENRRDNRVHFPPRIVPLYINCAIILEQVNQQPKLNRLKYSRNNDEPILTESVRPPYLCTSYGASSLHRSGWPGCFLVSAPSQSGPDTSPSHLGNQYKINVRPPLQFQADPKTPEPARIPGCQKK